MKITIDTLRERHSEQISYIKLDIGVSELEVLKGAVTTLKRDKPFLAISAHRKPLDPIIIARFIRKHGYERIPFGLNFRAWVKP